MTVLFVVATIIVFLSIDWIVQRTRERSAQTSLAPPPLAARPMPIRVPEGIFFSRSHTWMNLFPSGKVRMGIDDFVGNILKYPTVTLLKSAGENVKKGEPILSFREDDRSLTVRSPIEGRIIETNGEITESPELLKQLLFSDGWAYSIQPSRPSELRAMLLGEETRNWMHGELRRLREILSGFSANEGVVPALLQDGGPPAVGALSNFGAEAWARFEEEFLQVQ